MLLHTHAVAAVVRYDTTTTFNTSAHTVTPLKHTNTRDITQPLHNIIHDYKNDDSLYSIRMWPVLHKFLQPSEK